MRQWEPAAYGDEWAPVYDRIHERRPGVAAATDALARLAGGGRVLEFGIGTGRLALPLAARGVAVHGVDASEAMVARLRAKPDSERIPVVIGDFAHVRVDGTFDIVLLAFNTLFALPSQRAQCRCFANAARHLTERGAFVVEAFVPDLRRFEDDQTVRALDLEAGNVVLEVSLHDPVTQHVRSKMVTIDDGIHTLSVDIRYAWPAEIDLMALLAGLELDERWGDWTGEPFTRESKSHVSIYRPAP
ncbi:MAG: class I SAM-dependent DNA methyltransferase [Egibacteraceae bacterium]